MPKTAPTSRDPVCGMDVDIAGSLHSTSYRGLDFHFCSAQCLENFGKNPDLYALQTGLRDNIGLQPIPKRHRLPLAAGSDADIERACRQIGAMMGISSVSVENARLIVEYDLKQATLSQITAVAIAEGLHFSGGIHGLLRSFWNWSEANELNNAAHPGTGDCCNHPPAKVR